MTLLHQVASNVMRFSMELGGNAPFIVLVDANIEVAVEGALKAKTRRMGDACTAANRFFVHRSVVDEFSEIILQEDVETSGGQRHPGWYVGPLVDLKGLEKVESLVADAVGHEARVLTGGSRPEHPGYFNSPTVLVDVALDSELLSTEIICPVAAITPFDSEDEVLRLASDTEWGLAGYVHRWPRQGMKFASELEVGLVRLNTGIVSNPAVPFGGVSSQGSDKKVER